MKQYNNEKAIISLTSWKARINTVSKTIFSLLKNCPGFHIVLVLSEEEFPKKEDELPNNLKILIDNDCIEILWIYKNFKSLKKVLFTIEKYKDVPVISADDDCIYVCNYAEELYQTWLNNKDKFCTINAPMPYQTNGTATLYYPHCFGEDFIEELKNNKNLSWYIYADDAYYENMRFKRFNFEHKIVYLKPHKIWYTGDEMEPLHNIYGNATYHSNLRKIQSEELGFNVNNYLH